MKPGLSSNWKKIYVFVLQQPYSLEATNLTLPEIPLMRLWLIFFSRQSIFEFFNMKMQIDTGKMNTTYTSMSSIIFRSKYYTMLTPDAMKTCFLSFGDVCYKCLSYLKYFGPLIYLENRRKSSKKCCIILTSTLVWKLTLSEWLSSAL